MQITAREDQLCPGLLDFRFNFDLTFPRQLLGTSTSASTSAYLAAIARVLVCSCSACAA